MGRLCARQSNIPKPPFPRRNRLDEVHAARSAQTICAFRRGGRQPPAGRTLCAPTLRILFPGRVELQGEVRDMGPGRRCHAADWAHGRVDKPSDSGQTRFGLWPSLGSAHPFPTYLPYAPILRASLSRCGGCATRGCPYPFCPCGTFPPDRGNRPCGSEHNHSGFWPSLVSVPHSGPSALRIVTLRLARGRVAFAAARAGLRAASRPCARPRSAPSSPARGLRASHCHAADWAHGRVDNSDDSAKTHSRLGRSLGFWHPLCRYLPCAPMGRA